MLNDPWPHICMEICIEKNRVESQCHSVCPNCTLTLSNGHCPSIRPFIHLRKRYICSLTLSFDRQSLSIYQLPYLSFHWGICHHLFLHYVFESLFTTVHRLLNANGKKQKHARRQKHIRIPSLPQVFGIYSTFDRYFSAFFVFCVVRHCIINTMDGSVGLWMPETKLQR